MATKFEPFRAAHVRCERILAFRLRPGDLFSMVGPSYWHGALDKGSIGEKVYIRTNEPAVSAVDPAAAVWRLTIEIEPEA